jgi:hypothetical protein
MSLRIRQLNLRVQTGEGLYGTQIGFGDGLVLLRANNNMGKSTCLQAIIYALGLEKMLGPSSAIPLPHAMTRYIEDGDREIPVLESEVLLEIENQQSERLTIQRSVLGQRDERLITTWNGPKLTDPTGAFVKRDYFVRDPGAAQHEAGFSRKLAEFVGWQIPNVRRFNGSECPLYLEALCPLFFVEQKHGWSGIQANLPTYFGIREMAKRSVEFVLNLDAARMIEERQEIEQAEAELRSRWKNLASLVSTNMQRVNGRVSGLPEAPTAQWPLSISPSIEIFRGERWIAVQDAIDAAKTELTKLDSQPVETVGAGAAAASAKLELARKGLSEREVVASELMTELGREQIQLQSTETRLVSLHDDLRRNKDALKLKTFGSNAGWSLIEHTCPTCQQHIADTLLSQVSTENPMSVEDNITFIKKQIETFNHLKENSGEIIARKKSELASFQSEIDGLRAQIRALRQTLLSPTSSPSIEGVRKRVELEGVIKSLEAASLENEEAMQNFSEVAEAWRMLLGKKQNLPADGFSSADKFKLDRLRDLLREQLKQFGFSSLNPDTLEISKETYRPTREGFDLGFDLSASDNIRTIWAYLQGLLELSTEVPLNHFGMLVFDEPRQQEAAELSFQSLLKRASQSARRNQQIIFATSEPLENLRRMTEGLNPQIVSFDGRVLVKQS